MASNTADVEMLVGEVIQFLSADDSHRVMETLGAEYRRVAQYMLSERNDWQSRIEKAREDRDTAAKSATRDPAMEPHEQRMMRLQTQQTRIAEDTAKLHEQLAEFKRQQAELDKAEAMLKEREESVTRSVRSDNQAVMKALSILGGRVTGIRWDYEAGPRTVEGRVSAEKGDAVRTFTFDAYSLSEIMLADNLWAEVEAMRPAQFSY
jgi:uncharacterized membrane protein YkoI